MMWRQWGAEVKSLDLLSRNLDNSANSIDNKVTTFIECSGHYIYYLI